MIDIKDIPSIPKERVIELVREGKTHPNYGIATYRSRIMKAWYNAREDIIGLNEYTKSEIVKRSPIESEKDYKYRLENFDLVPLESKFLQTQQRIYDENNVQRTYPEANMDFWKDKEMHFDDMGDPIDTFFRDKALFTKEVEGFGAICVDLAMSGDRVIQNEGKPVPYPYICQAHEVIYFETWHGHLTILITAQQRTAEDREWRAFTKDKIYYFKEQDAQPIEINHKFGRTPCVLLKGGLDTTSGFRIGKPRRWNLSPLYKLVSELMYDLKLGSKYFGHPIMAVPDEMIRQISGAYDEDDAKYDPETVKNELGTVVVYPNDAPPSQLFYQADMQGLQHLQTVIFDNLINLIYQLAQIRDKSKVVHNSSGRSKQFDSVEEQGLLAQTATEMEAIERDVFDLMRKVRLDDEIVISYSKHHDLSSADEIWTQFVEGNQYGGVPKKVKEYQIKEYLRKKSAPQAERDALEKELQDYGFPMSSEEITALTGRIKDEILVLKARPELKNTTLFNNIEQEIDNIMLGIDDNDGVDNSNQIE